MNWRPQRHMDKFTLWTHLPDDLSRNPHGIFKKFTEFVQPKTNPMFSRYKFHHEIQKDESTDEFVARLTLTVTVTRDCDFGDKTDWIVFGCRSENVQEKLTDKGTELALEITVQIGQWYEYGQKQMHTMKSNSASVDLVWNRKKRSNQENPQSKRICRRRQNHQDQHPQQLRPAKSVHQMWEQTSCKQDRFHQPGVWSVTIVENPIISGKCVDWNPGKMCIQLWKKKKMPVNRSVKMSMCIP